MPYQSNKDLPKAVKDKLDEKKQNQWRKVFNSIHEETDDEGRAASGAWSAVNKGEPGRFIKRDDKQRYTLGIVYEPNIVDSQNDFSDEMEIEKACWSFMRKLQGKTGLTKTALSLLESIVKSLDEDEPVTLDITDVYDDILKAGLNDMHVNTPLDEALGDIVECYISPVDFDLTLPDGTHEHISKGTWLMGTVWNPDYFAKIESGERNGLSMEGKGRRVNA